MMSSSPSDKQHDDATIMNEIRDIYMQHTPYGYRRIHVALRHIGYKHNIKKTHRLMQATGLRGIAPGPNTSTPNVAHEKYPYLLKKLEIVRPNQVWSVDITYIKITGGYVYLTCIIDIFSRKIVGWAVSPFLDTKTCIEAAQMALKCGTPEIINSDQGCQFTSEMWCKFWLDRNVKVSMDGKGRWADNIYIERFWRTLKYEYVYLYERFVGVRQVRIGLTTFIDFYNKKRFHQSLDYLTPDDVFYQQELIKQPTKPYDIRAVLQQSPAFS